MPSAAQPTLALAQLPEMDSAERNEAHEAACTPCRGLYQAQINGWRHSPGAPALPGPIPVFWEWGAKGGSWESLIGLVHVCVCVFSVACVCLGHFNQVFPTANT